MKRKFIALTIFIILFVSLFNSGVLVINAKENDKVTEKVMVDITSNNVKNLNSASSVVLSYSQINEIKNRFLEIEKNYQGLDKINRQIKILKKINILPSDFSVNTLLSTLYDYNGFNGAKFSHSFLKRAFDDPFIVSHLTIGGRIQCLYSLRPLLYNSTNISFHRVLNGSYINSVYGVLPIYIGAIFRPVFITIIGPQRMISTKICYFPFFEILVPCIGFSIAFYYINKNSHPIILFEYNLDACFAGFIAGL